MYHPINKFDVTSNLQLEVCGIFRCYNLHFKTHGLSTVLRLKFSIGPLLGTILSLLYTYVTANCFFIESIFLVLLESRQFLFLFVNGCNYRKWDDKLIADCRKSV